MLWDISLSSNAQSEAQYDIASLVGAGTVLALSPRLLSVQISCRSMQANLTVDVDAACQMLEYLERFVTLDKIADRLLAEELQRSQQSFGHLLQTINAKSNFEGTMPAYTPGETAWMK
ncbi:MAG: hypothetical protein KME16_10490 [Scytolyngbya sp. HA4215-MV1]|nr:hypothetical protein [Scytolyngbya sp. HA4215-MV1]